MSALKKTRISHNILYVLNNNPIILFFNHNHMSIEEWRVLKNQLSKIEKVNTLVVKNKIASTIVKSNIEHNTQLHNNDKNIHSFSPSAVKELYKQVHTLFQGPTFLIGVDSPRYAKQLFNVIKKQNKLIFTGGIYQKKVINHLDLDHLLKLEKGVYESLLSTLQSPLYLTPLHINVINLYNLLNIHVNTKSSDT